MTGPTSSDLGLEVRRFATEHHRRRLIPTTLHVGRPGGVRRVLTAEPGWDTGLRADLLLRLVESCRPGGGREAIWLTRAGDGEVRDDDLQWLRAARWAAGVHGPPLRSFTVVTRSGWRDLLTDASRTWVRTRPLRPEARR